jgi:hypothetical protein
MRNEDNDLIIESLISTIKQKNKEILEEIERNEVKSDVKLALLDAIKYHSGGVFQMLEHINKSDISNEEKDDINEYLSGSSNISDEKLARLRLLRESDSK